MLDGKCCGGTEGCIHWLVDNSAIMHDLEKLFGKLENVDSFDESSLVYYDSCMPLDGE